MKRFNVDLFNLYYARYFITRVLNTKQYNYSISTLEGLVGKCCCCGVRCLSNEPINKFKIKTNEDNYSYKMVLHYKIILVVTVHQGKQRLGSDKRKRQTNSLLTRRGLFHHITPGR